METIRCAYNAQNVDPFYVGSTPAVFSSDGALVATPLEEDVVITDLHANCTLHELEGDGETVTALAMTPDGSMLAVVLQSQQLRIYDVVSGTLSKLYKLSAPVYIAAADSTSSLFAFGATDGTVIVWDCENGYVTHTLRGHGSIVCSLAFYGHLHSAQWMLALGDTMGTSKVWNLVTRKCIATHTEHTGAVRGVAFLDEYFMTGGRDEVVVVYKTENLRKVVATYSVRHLVEACGFLEGYFYTAGSGCQLRLWDMDGKPAGGSEKPLETTEELVVNAVCATEASLWLILSDQTLQEVDVSDVPSVPTVRRVAGNHGIVADMRYAGPNRSLVAMATNAPALRMVNPLARYDVCLCEGHTDLLNCIDASEDGMWLLTGSKDATARLWHWDDDAQRFTSYTSFVGHAGAVTACALPKNVQNYPKYVVTAAADLTVKRWKVPAHSSDAVHASEYTRRAHDKEINALAVAPNDEYFATASLDKTAKIWHTESGDTVGILRGHRRGLWDVTFCQYDKVVATASGDKTAKIWSLSDYSCTATLEGHTNAVQRCRFISKNKQVVTSGADGLLKVWDVKASECVATLDGHANRIWALDVSDDGQTMVSADADGRMCFWTDNTDQLLLEQQEKERARVEQEQALQNCVGAGDWNNAFLLALTLDHLMRLYNVITALIAAHTDDLPVGSVELEETMRGLDPVQMAALMRRVRDWNVNFRHFDVAQKVLAVVVDHLDMENADIRKVVDAMIPYNERHYERVDGLVEASYVLDYVVGMI